MLGDKAKSGFHAAWRLRRENQYEETPVRPNSDLNSKEKGHIEKNEEDEKEEGEEGEEENEEDEDKDEEQNEEEQEGARVKVQRKPEEPSKQEREEHEITHIPFRTWCRHCVRGKSKDSQHRTKKKEEKEEEKVPTISMDYMFLGRKGTNGVEEEDKMIPVLVIKDGQTKCIFAHVVPKKGGGMEWLAKKVVSDIEAMGYGRIILKSDQEVSITELQSELKYERERLMKEVGEKVKMIRNAITILENSPVGESKANGDIENAIQQLQGQVRTIKDQVQFHAKVKIPVAHPLLAWLIPFASLTITRYSVGSDGRTAYERVKGRSCRRPMACFGESIHFKPLKPARIGDKSEPKWE